MKKNSGVLAQLRLAAFAASWLVCVAVLAAPAADPQPPSVLYGELFDAVQRARVYPDSKTFADAIPNAPAEDIMAAYRRERAAASFDLAAFTKAHFKEPESAGSAYKTDPNQDVCTHIDALWPVLTRGPDSAVAGSSLLPLPHLYVVPGGRYREIYYWDSYFTMSGLETSSRSDLVDEMLANFAYLIDTYGHIPNGNRTYYLSRSQPPFFAAMVGLAARRSGDAAYAKYLPQLLREHAFWMKGAAGLKRGTAALRVVRLADGTLLNRYWDDRPTPRDESYLEDVETAARSRRPAPEVYRHLRAAAESGWDFSARWLTDPKDLSTIHTSDFLPVDLNSLLYELERAIGLGYVAKQDAANAVQWTAIAELRAAAIREVFWNEKRHTFTDYLWAQRKLADTVTLAGLSPLFFGVASEDQAKQVAGTTRLTLLRPEGVVPTAIVSGQQWDAPNGWPPLQWITIQGLKRYGENALAEAITRGWVRENVEGFQKTRKLVEKYDITGDDAARDGEYPTQDGFGWTNAVLRGLLREYPIAACAAR